MEAFGRSIAVMLSMAGIVFSLLFYKTAAVRWQKAETVRSMSQRYAEHVLSVREIRASDWKVFREQLNRLGEYRTELAVYERKRYEGERGRVYLYEESDVEEEDRMLTDGSYIRLVVTEAENGKMETILYGNGYPIIAGGRVG